MLAAVAEWGVASLERLNGMFAFAVWDRQHHELLLARDRYGIKPLYWGRIGDTFLFGSEVKALLAHGATAGPIWKELARILHLPELLHEPHALRGRPHSHAWRLHDGAGTPGRRPSRRRFTGTSTSKSRQQRPTSRNTSRSSTVYSVQAVNRQLVSDVPVSSYLSGGMDSGAVTAVASRQLPNLQTFTVGFDLHSASGIEIGFDERERAELLSYLLRTEHYEMVLRQATWSGP